MPIFMPEQLIGDKLISLPTFAGDVGTRNHSGFVGVRFLEVESVIDVPKYMGIVGWIFGLVSLEPAPGN